MTRLALSFGLAVWVGTLSAATNSGGTVGLLRVPDGGVQPKAVAEANGHIHLVYLKGDPKASDVFYASRGASSTNFGKPLRVNSQAGSAIAMGTVRGADIAVGRGSRVHVAWNGSQRSGMASGAPMLYSRLNEAGDGFEPQRNLMTSTTHLDGGGSVAADSEGNVYVVWHGHHKTGPQDEQHRAVFMARSSDGGKTFDPEKEVSPASTGVCGCCGLKALADEHGRVAILFRAANAAGDRDVTLLLSPDRGKTFQASVLGPWKISMCPMSTMYLGEEADGSLLAAWETAGQVWYARISAKSGDHALALSPAGEAPKLGRKHPVMVAGAKGSGLLMAWTEGTGWERGGSLAWECIDSGSSGHTDGVPVWGSVTAVAEPDGSFRVIY